MKRLVIGLLILAGVLVAADWGSAALAESAVSRDLRDRLGLADDPSVRINGFPFLTQAVSGRYRSIEATADRVPVGQLRDVQVRAKLTDVTAPLGGLLGSGPTNVQVGHAEGAARVKSDDIERLLPEVSKLGIANVDANGLEDAVKQGGDPVLRGLDPETVGRFTGTVKFLGKEYQIAVLAELQVADGAIRVVPHDVRLGDSKPLPGPLQALVTRMFTVTLDPGRLPFGVVPTKVQPRDGTLEISGETSDVRLGAGAA